MTTTKPTSPHLLSSFDLHRLALSRRVVVSPLTRAQAGQERVTNDLMAEYYARRAYAGLIIHAGPRSFSGERPVEAGEY